MAYTIWATKQRGEKVAVLDDATTLGLDKLFTSKTPANSDKAIATARSIVAIAGKSKEFATDTFRLYYMKTIVADKPNLVITGKELAKVATALVTIVDAIEGFKRPAWLVTPDLESTPASKVNKVGLDD